VFGPSADTLRLRFRSSTNAEDLDSLSGAGLYDSKSGCLADDLDEDDLGPSRCLSAEDAADYRAQLEAARTELAEHPDRTWVRARIEDLEGELSNEKSAESAIRKVWASLWTQRAFEERAYWGLDHLSVFMGIAVNASFTRERLDAVAITALEADDGPTLYRVVSQVAEVGVVRPDDPTAVPETLVFRRGHDDAVLAPEVLVSSSFAAEGDSLWSEAQVQTLGRLLYQVQDQFQSHVYPSLQPLSLDLEIKLTHDDRIVIKQARPYVTAGP
jgi:pyruvate, water dikinase